METSKYLNCQREELISEVLVTVAPSLAWVASEVTNLWVVQDQGSKYACIMLAMTTLATVQTSFLMSTTLICRLKELSVVEWNTSNFFHPTWKPAFCAKEAKMFWIASCVPMCSLPWVQCKRWMPVGSMGCVHTHQGRHVIGGCGSLNYVQSDVKKIGQNNQKVRKVSRAISEMLALGPEHDKIQAWWASSIVSKNMLKKGTMVQTFQNGILKLNHLMFNELFKRRKTCVCWGR